jgi:hypothetical protein
MDQYDARKLACIRSASNNIYGCFYGNSKSYLYFAALLKK